jgi:hypothetical protein
MLHLGVFHNSQPVSCSAMSVVQYASTVKYVNYNASTLTTVPDWMATP